MNNRITYLSQIANVLYIGHEGGVTLFENNRFKSFSFSENEKNTNKNEKIIIKGNVVNEEKLLFLDSINIHIIDQVNDQVGLSPTDIE